jgi:hypothetical protein
MDWDAIGAVGELVGAAAVVLTLFYLARQIKTSSDISKAELFERSNDRFSRFRSIVIEHPEIALNMGEPESLTEEQRLVAQSIVLEIAFSFAVSYESQDLIYSQERWDVVEAANNYLARYPAFRSSAIRQLRENAFEKFADELEARSHREGTV